MKYDLIELCCGLGAVTWAAVGAPPPPVSRIGSKRGYVGPILEALGIEPGTTKRVLMVDSDRHLCAALESLLNRDRRSMLAADISNAAKRPDAKKVWEASRYRGVMPSASAWFLWTAGARGGVGGFKGRHKLRPSVDGFIPSRKSLAERLRNFDVPGKVEVLHADADALDPRKYAPTRVYCDPQYPDRTGYGDVLDDATTLATRWRAAGHRVVVSLPFGICDADSTRDITKLRKGQTRRSMTKDSVEWLSVFEP